VLKPQLQKLPRQPPREEAPMAKAKLHQIKLTSGDKATQPPFPGGWVLAVFDALNSFAPALAAGKRARVSQRTQERIKAANVVKQFTYDEIETKLVEFVEALFPKVSAVNGFAKKYVTEYFRLWKSAAEIAPTWVKCLGFTPGDSSLLGRALVRDLLLRLCYLESCERRLTKQSFAEAELAFLGHDSPAQIYQVLISEQALSLEELASRLKVTEKRLQRVKRGESLPSVKLLLELKQPATGCRLLAGIGFFDQLLRTLGLHKGVLRNEFLAVATVFFRIHPPEVEAFTGGIPRTMANGSVKFDAYGFEHFAACGDGLLLHPGFDGLWPEMPNALWRCHLYALQFARMVDLAQAYCQFAKESTDSPLEVFLRDAESESDDCRYRWMEKLRQISD
jgi:hypothetical protein